MPNERNEVDVIVEAAKEFWEEVKAGKESMDELEEWNSPAEILNNLKTVAALMGRAMICVETAVVQTGKILSSEEKRAAAAQVLDAMVPLPGFAEMLDGPAFEYGLGFIANLWNSKVGHAWPTE